MRRFFESRLAAALELLLDLKQRVLIGYPDGSAKSGANAWGSPNLPPPGVPNAIDSMPLS